MLSSTEGACGGGPLGRGGWGGGKHAVGMTDLRSWSLRSRGRSLQNWSRRAHWDPSISLSPSPATAKWEYVTQAFSKLVGDGGCIMHIQRRSPLARCGAESKSHRFLWPRGHQRLQPENRRFPGERAPVAHRTTSHGTRSWSQKPIATLLAEKDHQCWCVRYYCRQYLDYYTQHRPIHPFSQPCRVLSKNIFGK